MLGDHDVKNMFPIKAGVRAGVFTSSSGVESINSVLLNEPHRVRYRHPQDLLLPMVMESARRYDKFSREALESHAATSGLVKSIHDTLVHEGILTSAGEFTHRVKVKACEYHHSFLCLR